MNIRNKTHLWRNMAVALLACMGIVSCSQDELTDTQGDLPPVKYPLELTAGGMAVATPTTRSTMDNNWDGVNTVAVQIGGEVKEYAVTPIDSEKKFAKLTSSNPFYWQSATESIDITAWHPYSPAYPETWTVKANQGELANYQASDLIMGKFTLAFADRNNAEKNKIIFEHQTAKVVINLTATEGFTLDDAEVKLLNLTGVEGNGSTVTPYRPDDIKQTYLALLNGQTIRANTNFIQVTANSTDYCYQPDADKQLVAGYVYTYNITVKAEGITGVQVQVTPWEESGTPAEGSTGDWQAADNIIRLSECTEDNDDLVIDKNTVIDGNGTSTEKPFTGTITVNADDVIVVLKGVTIDTEGQAITVNGNVTLRVQGKNRLVSGDGAGVFIKKDKTVTIISQDKKNNVLTAIGGNGSAGIGSSSTDIHGGSIVIRNVSVNAYGSRYRSAISYSAAIGNAESDYWGTIQNILIENSMIVAQRLKVNWLINHIGNAQGNQAPITIKSSTIEKRTRNDDYSIKEDDYIVDGTETYDADGNLVTQ